MNQSKFESAMTVLTLILVVVTIGMLAHGMSDFQSTMNQSGTAGRFVASDK